MHLKKKEMKKYLNNHMEKTQSQIKALLNPDQLEKFEKIIKLRKQHFKNNQRGFGQQNKRGGGPEQFNQQKFRQNQFQKGQNQKRPAHFNQNNQNQRPHPFDPKGPRPPHQRQNQMRNLDQEPFDPEDTLIEDTL